MTKSISYCCPESGCRAPLTVKGEGLGCPAGHFFAFAAGTDVPIFASQPEVSNEYSIVNAAEVHDNSLRWVFATFDEQEPRLRERLIERLGLKPGDRVLVTGAGAGNDLPYLVRAMDGVGEVYAQDIAKEMLLAGVERYQDSLTTPRMHLQFSVSDATNLPFADDAFDAAYHFGGINLFPDVAKGIAEMNRVVKPGGKIVIGDEGLGSWLLGTEVGKMLVTNNALYAYEPPLAHLPETARSVKLTWELCNTFYVIEFNVSDLPLPINIDVPHVGTRGGSIRSRYAGQLEGVTPALRDKLYAEAERRGVSRVELIESFLRSGLGKD